MPFKYGTPDGYEFYLRTGPLQNFDEKFFHGKIEYWKELIDNDTYSPYWQARNIRQHMKSGEAGDDDGGRLVRCGGFVRRAAAVQLGGEAKPGRATT